MDILLLKLFHYISGISTARLYIHEEIISTIPLLRRPDILWITGIRVKTPCCQHTANLIFRVDLVGNFCCHRRSHQFVMRCLILHLLLVFSLPETNSCSHKRKMHQHIDFVERHPVVNSPLKMFKQDSAVFYIGINQLSTSP